MHDAYDFWASRIAGDRLAEIGAMWSRFAEVVPELDAELALPPDKRTDTLDRLMVRVLGPFGDRLDYEFAPGSADDQVLVITAGQRHDQRVLARAILHGAPDLPGWTFLDVREEVEHAADAPELIRERDSGRPLLLTGIDAAPGAHRRIDVTPRGRGDTDELALQTRLAFTTLLGEEACRDWLGQHQPKKRGLLSLITGGRGRGGWCDAFRETCLKLIGEVQAELPVEPAWGRPYDHARQIMYRANRLEPDPAWRHDTITGYTSYREMTQARMSGDALASARFSRFGESFCGLKVGRTPEFPFGETEQRVALAEGVHLMLSTREEGGVTGEALGHAHVYVDLAITDLKGGVATLAELLDRIELTGPAWLIFDEAGLTDRALPLTPMTPPEPREEYG